MSRLTRPILLASVITMALSAQEPRMGLALNLVMPAGSFRSTTYAPTVQLPGGQEEGYDVGLGAQFTMSFPLETRTALRLNLSGQTVRGTNTSPGATTLTLEHNLFSVGAEMQFFSGSAYRHRGAYLLAGLCADFESFNRGESAPYHYDDQWEATTRKARTAATFGVGRTFGYDGGLRFTLEAVYHKTLSGNDLARQEPPSTDFLKLSFGCVF